MGSFSDLTALIAASGAVLGAVVAPIVTYYIYNKTRYRGLTKSVVIEDMYSLFTDGKRLEGYLPHFLKTNSLYVWTFLYVATLSEIVSVLLFGLSAETAILGILILFLIMDYSLNLRLRNKIPKDDVWKLILRRDLKQSWKMKYLISLRTFVQYFTFLNGAIMIAAFALELLLLILGVSTTNMENSLSAIIATAFYVLLFEGMSRAFRDFNWINYKTIAKKILDKSGFEATVYVVSPDNGHESPLTGSLSFSGEELNVSYKDAKEQTWIERIPLDKISRIALSMVEKRVANDSPIGKEK